MDDFAQRPAQPVEPAPEPSLEAPSVAAAPRETMPPPTMTPPRARPRWGGAAATAFAFTAGLGLMALAVIERPAWLGLAPAATVDVSAGQTPVVIVPAKTGGALPTIDLAALSGRESELAARLADLEARTTAIDGAASRAAGNATRAEGLMVAFAARRALDRGLGLGFLEDQVRARFGAAQPRAVAAVIQAAREPVTLEDLRAGLDGVAPELATGAASDGWWPSLRRELGGLFVLHRAGTPSPLPLDRITRARRLVDAGQIEAALAEVARTPGASRAARWIAAARRYIGARRALDVIETTALLAPAPAVPTTVTTDVPGLGATPPNP